MKRSIYILSLIILGITLVGCSANQNNPLTPGDSDNYTSTIGSIGYSPVLASDFDKDGNPTGGVGTLGYYHGEIDPVSGSVIFEPIRNTASALPDSLTVDITNFLTKVPCLDCAKMKGINIDSEGNAILKIGIKHPFPAGRQSEAPSSTNRLDLHLFSVRGFIVSDGVLGGPTKIFPHLGQLEVGGWRLLNASGYSSEFDAKWDNIAGHETHSHLHPFILHFDDYSIGTYNKAHASGFNNVASPTGNTVMRMGSDYDYKDYIVKFPHTGEKMKFMYAITASYGLSAKGKSEWLYPKYRCPQYCQKNATYVKVASIENHLDDVNETSWAELLLEVLDINHGVEIVTDMEADIDLMDADSSVNEISIDVPDLSDAAFVFSGEALTKLYSEGGTFVRQGWRNPLTPTQYKLKIQNKKTAPVGSYIGLVKVKDSYPASQNVNVPGNAIPAVPPQDDPINSIFKIEEWATYTVFSVNVSLGNRKPNCELLLSEESIIGGNKIEAEPGPGTMDPDGSIVLYEFDKDYDGEVFDVDKSNTNGASVELGPYLNDTGEDIVITVAMRVTDNGDPAESSICTKDFTVVYFNPVIFYDDFVDNSNNWLPDAGKFWGIKDGFLSSAGGTGSQALGPGCYGKADAGIEAYVSSRLIFIPPIPDGYSKIRITIMHAVNTEIFPLNPYDFTDDCDLLVKPDLTPVYKLITSGGEQLYNRSEFESKNGPSFAGEIGIVPAFGADFEGKTSYFEDNTIAGKGIKLRFRQQTDDGIENCEGGWWVDWVKIEFIM
jgi:hypothetical protein